MGFQTKNLPEGGGEEGREIIQYRSPIYVFCLHFRGDVFFVFDTASLIKFKVCNGIDTSWAAD